MYPVLFAFGPIRIFAFSTFCILGALLFCVISYRLLKRYNLPWMAMFDHSIPLVVISLVVGRIFHILLQYVQYQDQYFRMLYLLDGGIFLYGLLGCFLGLLIIFLQREKQDIPLWLDILSAPAAGAAALYSLGSFLSGKHMGIPTDSPLGITLDGPNVPLSGVAVHPVDLYMMALMVLFFVLSMFLLTRKKTGIGSGRIFVMFVMTFAIAQLLIQKHTADITYLWDGYNVEIVLSWWSLILGFGYIFYRRFSHYAYQTLQKTHILEHLPRRYRR
jgi:prolipoprotein diacylglyceryltransferase